MAYNYVRLSPNSTQTITITPSISKSDHDRIVAEKDARIAELERVLAGLRRGHYICDDCGCSCPKSSEGRCDEREGDGCDCGADEHNAKIEAALHPVVET